MFIQGHVTRQDEEQKQNSGVKERINHDNCHKETAISKGVLSYHAILLALHLYGHVRFTFIPVLCRTIFSTSYTIR